MPSCVSFPSQRAGRHVSTRCGVSPSRDCGTVSLCSLRICPSTHHATTSGSAPADGRHTTAQATSPNLVATDSAASSRRERHSGTVPAQPTVLPGNSPVWAVKCVHYAMYYRTAALGEVAKSRGVWYLQPTHVASDGCAFVCILACVKENSADAPVHQRWGYPRALFTSLLFVIALEEEE